MMRVKAYGIDNNNIINSTVTMLTKYIVTLFFLCAFTLAGAQVATKTMMTSVNYADLDKLIAAAKVNYPRTHYFEHRVLAQQFNLKKVKLGWFDVFTFTFLYSPNNSTTLVNPSILNGYQVGLYFNLGNLLKNKPIINQAKEELYSTQNERDEYYINLTALVKERYFSYIQQLAILKVKQEAEADAESNMVFFRDKYQKGEVPLDDYNKSQVNLADRVQAKIEAEGAVLFAKAQLEEFVGKKIEEVL